MNMMNVLRRHGRGKTTRGWSLLDWAVVAMVLLGLGMSGLGDGVQMLLRMAGGGLGVLAAWGMTVVWGERTRPKNRIAWWALGGAILFWLFLVGVGLMEDTLVGPYALGPLTLFVFLFVFHDHHLSVSVLLGALVLAVLVQPGLTWSEAGESEATWGALATLAAVFAAAFKRERLAQTYDVGTPGPWTMFRLLFVSVWTIVILSLREEVQWAQIFQLMGLDASGIEGQVALVALILLGLVVAAFALKPRRDPPSGPS